MREPFASRRPTALDIRFRDRPIGRPAAKLGRLRPSAQARIQTDGAARTASPFNLSKPCAEVLTV